MPKKLLIVGGGVIGCEFASLFQELGVQVVILEALEQIIDGEGKEISQILTDAFKKRGIAIHTGISVQTITSSKKGVVAQATSKTETLSIEADCALIAVGRKLNSDNIGLENTGVATAPNGAILTDKAMQTNIPGIYAIGDVTGKWLLAHAASHQGVIAAAHACGESSEAHSNVIPSIIFTHPEIGTVGLTLEKALSKGYHAVVGKFPFQALGKSKAAAETEGFAQVIVEKNTGRILGAQVVGYEAATLIAEMAIAMHNELTVECISSTVHAHPTLSEAWMEAAWIAQGTPLHFSPKAKTVSHQKAMSEVGA